MKEPSDTSGKQTSAWMWLALSVIVFGVLMALRAELQSVWLRALVAGVLFAFLYLAIQRHRRRQ